MELHHTNSIFIIFTDDGICESFGGKGLADTGRTLQDDIFLSEDKGAEFVVFGFGDEYFAQKVRFGIFMVELLFIVF